MRHVVKMTIPDDRCTSSQSVGRLLEGGFHRNLVGAQRIRRRDLPIKSNVFELLHDLRDPLGSPGVPAAPWGPPGDPYPWGEGGGDCPGPWPIYSIIIFSFRFFNVSAVVILILFSIVIVFLYYYCYNITNIIIYN